jgi:hypothetical protein
MREEGDQQTVRKVRPARAALDSIEASPIHFAQMPHTVLDTPPI